MNYEERFLKLLEKIEGKLDLPQPEWFSIAGVAVLTNLSADHVRRAVLGGTLVASNMGTPDRPTYRISRAAVDKWMKEREAGPRPPKRKVVVKSPEAWTHSPHRKVRMGEVNNAL